MDENIFRPIAAREETETARPIEPFYNGDLEAARWRHLHMRARRRQLRRMHGCRFIHGENAEDLKSFRAHGRFADHTGAFARRLKTIFAKNGDVQQDIGFAAIWNDEAIAFGDIEPFDAPGDLNEIERFEAPRAVKCACFA